MILWSIVMPAATQPVLFEALQFLLVSLYSMHFISLHELLMVVRIRQSGQRFVCSKIRVA